MVDFKESLAIALQNCVADFWKGDNFSDFSVVVNDTTFKCHRVILAACSGFFSGLFQSDMSECRENRVTVKDLSDTTFRLVLDSIYTGKDLLTKDNIFDVWSAAIQLQIGYLVGECENFVTENVTEENCFDIFSFAKCYGSETTKASCLRFFASHFDKLKDTEKLLQLSFDDMYSVMDNDNLSTTSEDYVLETILKWAQCDTALNNNLLASSQTASEIANVDILSEQSSAESNIDLVTTLATYPSTTCNEADVNCGYASMKCDNRTQYLTQLLSACRLCLVSLTGIEQVLKNNQLLAGCRDAKSVITDALMYHLCIERRQTYWPKAATYRLSCNMKHVMVFLSVKDFQTYDLNNGCIRDFVNYSSDILNWTVIDNTLHIVEKKDGGKISFSKYTKEGSWSCISSIVSEVYDQPLLFVHGQYVYFPYRLGSSDEHLVLKRSEFTNTGSVNEMWAFCCLIQSMVDAVVGVNKYILLFNTKTNTAASTVNCYNIVTGEKHMITIDGTTRNMVNFCHQDDVYLLQRGGCLWRIVVSDSARVVFERVANLWDFDCDLSGCVVYHNQLYVFCQDDSRFKTHQHLTSLPGIDINIKVVGIQSSSKLVPMVIPVPSS